MRYIILILAIGLIGCNQPEKSKEKTPFIEGFELGYNHGYSQTSAECTLKEADRVLKLSKETTLNSAKILTEGRAVLKESKRIRAEWDSIKNHRENKGYKLKWVKQ